MTVLIAIGVICSVLTLLAHIDGTEIGIDFEKLEQGETLHVITAPTLWQEPVLISRGFSPELLVHLPSMAGVGAVALLIVLFRHVRRRSSWMTSAFMMLALIPVSYAMTRLALSGNDDPVRAGTWVAFSYLSVFYALLGCAVFTGFDLLTHADGEEVDATSVQIESALTALPHSGQ